MFHLSLCHQHKTQMSSILPHRSTRRQYTTTSTQPRVHNDEFTTTSTRQRVHDDEYTTTSTHNNIVNLLLSLCSFVIQKIVTFMTFVKNIVSCSILRQLSSLTTMTVTMTSTLLICYFDDSRGEFG